MARFDQPIEPMTLGNMRELGVVARRVMLELPPPSDAERR
jgi:hypothetical protein